MCHLNWMVSFTRHSRRVDDSQIGEVAHWADSSGRACSNLKSLISYEFTRILSGRVAIYGHTSSMPALSRTASSTSASRILWCGR